MTKPTPLGQSGPASEQSSWALLPGFQGAQPSTDHGVMPVSRTSYTLCKGSGENENIGPRFKTS